MARKLGVPWGEKLMCGARRFAATNSTKVKECGRSKEVIDEAIDIASSRSLSKNEGKTTFMLEKGK